MSFFLSYSSKNKELVLKLKSALEFAGISCWIDKSDIPPAEDWGEHIDEALRDCDGVIVCITPESSVSTYVHYEWAYALGWHKDSQQRRIVGVKLVDTPTRDIHPRLQLREMVDLIMLTPDNPEWNRLLFYLRDLEQHGVASPIVRQAERVIETSPYESERDKAIRGLENINDPWATRVLINNLQHTANNTRDQVIRSLMLRLQSSNDPIDDEMVPDLIDASKVFDTDWQLEPVALALGRSRTPTAAIALKEAYQRSTNEKSKAKIADALGLFAGNPLASIYGELLVETINNAHDNVLLLAAAGSAIKLRSKDALAAIGTVLERENMTSNSTLRNQLFERLGMAKDDALDILKHLLKSQDPGSRAEAAKTMRNIASESAISGLREHLPNETNQQIRIDIRYFLNRHTKS